jgi:Flp pilus assembly protein TadG
MNLARLRRHRPDEGAALVEFALALPLFALLLFALVDSGLAFGGFITFRNGVDAGARLASVNNYQFNGSGCASDPTSQMACTIQSRIGTSAGVVAGSVQVQICLPTGASASAPCAGSGATGAVVDVCAVARLRSATGITPFINNRTVHATSAVRIEKDISYSSVGSGIC